MSDDEALAGDWAFTEVPRALGVVPDEGRGSLPFALLHGESLVACAAWAMGEADVELLDFNVGWDLVREAGRPLVVHDPLCPLTPAEFLAEAAARAAAEDAVVVGTDGAVVLSPVVLPARVVADLRRRPDLADLAELVRRLHASYDVVAVTAPREAARVSSPDEVLALEATSRPSRPST